MAALFKVLLQILQKTKTKINLDLISNYILMSFDLEFCLENRISWFLWIDCVIIDTITEESLSVLYCLKECIHGYKSILMNQSIVCADDITSVFEDNHAIKACANKDLLLSAVNQLAENKISLHIKKRRKSRLLNL